LKKKHRGESGYRTIPLKPGIKSNDKKPKKRKTQTLSIERKKVGTEKKQKD